MVSAKCQSEFPELTSKVEGDAERSAELVVPCVPLADRGVRVVDAGSDPEAPQLLRDLRDERLELGVGREGHDEALDRGDGRREGQDGAVDVVGAGPVRVLEERVEDAADTERGFDDVRDKLADCDTERQTPALISERASFSKTGESDHRERCVPCSLISVGVMVKTLDGTWNS